MPPTAATVVVPVMTPPVPVATESVIGFVAAVTSAPVLSRSATVIVPSVAPLSAALGCCVMARRF